MTREKMRKLEGIVALTLSILAAFVGLFWLVFILGDVLVHGIKALTPDLFLQDPVPAGVKGGGLRNAFIGQLLITLLATLIGVPIGVLGGTFRRCSRQKDCESRAYSRHHNKVLDRHRTLSTPYW
jgi:phosphate transport system permease protein